MYISKVGLKNIRCFNDETIELGDSHPSLLIAGNNATGKSSILRSIAMGSCDEASSGGLLRELSGDFIRTNEKDATIEIEFIEKGEEKWRIETKLKLYEELNFERVEQNYFKNKETEPRTWKEFPWEKLFIVGYGAGLRTDGIADYDQYFSGDAVYTLFKYSQPLQNPELVWRRLQSIEDINKEEIDKNISSILGEILDLGKNTKVILEPNGIFINKDKNKVELGAVGDGCRAMTTLILDILSWQFLMLNKEHENGDDWKPLSIGDISGIVIIDEIEKHLHPLLQRQIIKHLYDKFPRIQFIISTHSPLCVSGISDVPDESWKILTNRVIDGHSEIIEKSVPSGLRADQILVDYFDLNTTVSIEVEKTINEYQKLFSKEKKTEDDQSRLKSLVEQMEKYNYDLAESVKDREVQKELLTILQNEVVG